MSQRYRAAEFNMSPKPGSTVMINTACNDLATLLQAPKKTHAKATAGDTSTAAGVTIKPEPGTPEEQDNMERLGRLYIKQEPATAAAAGAVKQEPGVGAGGVPSGPVLEQGKVYFFYRCSAQTKEGVAVMTKLQCSVSRWYSTSSPSVLNK